MLGSEDLILSVKPVQERFPHLTLSIGTISGREKLCALLLLPIEQLTSCLRLPKRCQLVLIVLVDSVNLITFSSHSYGFLLALLVDLMLSTVWEKTFMLTLHLCQIRWFNASNLLKTDACGLGVRGGK